MGSFVIAASTEYSYFKIELNSPQKNKKNCCAFGVERLYTYINVNEVSKYIFENFFKNWV